MRLQKTIAAAVGGEVEDYVHLTLQRFELADGSNEEALLDAIQAAICGNDPPDVVASGLFATYHRYFERHSVRWRVEATQDLGRLTLQSAQSILHQGGKSHWPNAEAPIAQFMTAAWIPEMLEIPQDILHDYPKRLMSVSRVEVTRLVDVRKFDIIRKFDIGQ